MQDEQQKPDGDIQGRPKTLAEARVWMKTRLRSRTHPMNALDADEGVDLIDRLPGLGGAEWAAHWREAGDACSASAERAEQAGSLDEACRLFMKASGLYFMGRFPCPDHPAKLRCAELERETYLRAARLWKLPVQVVRIPFAGRAGEGDTITALLRRPANVERPPVVVMWGGVDAWKEQMTQACDALLALGIATVAMDNAGTGESPVKGVQDAERQFTTVFDWIDTQSDLDGQRLACLGRSFGGYWATKLALLYPDRLRGAVNWGGGAHYMFQPDWIGASRYPDSYLMGLVETRCRMLGARNDDEYLAFFKRLSLLDQGLLDRRSAPLLLVNGREDKQCPIEDLHLLTEHGNPKHVRLFPGGHMGLTPQTLPTIVSWLAGQLGVAG
ncbi:alpha/beta fold hydrolase [uncultured Pseudacidovorax sp.]|uniref:alpha/beta hydrolase family protein n=1 Tax=uncultured Pseudacidovorax sp. TaxID=679313 RepID=UPI0025EB2BF8|nr:alpha/beta fold hydrolase [uncultured Pseudacidovorax sp.]